MEREPLRAPDSIPYKSHALWALALIVSLSLEFLHHLSTNDLLTTFAILTKVWEQIILPQIKHVNIFGNLCSVFISIGTEEQKKIERKEACKVLNVDIEIYSLR